ncbi:MAG: AAA family ATPase [Pseudonocardia sediminis]
MAPLDEVLVQPYRIDESAWYWSLPPVAQLRAEGLRFTTPVTVLVGENGAGKSTLVEAIATAWESSLTGAQGRHWSAGVSAEDADLSRHLGLRGDRGRPHGGCFLRAEAMHGLFDAADRAGVRDYDGPLGTRSHGQAFLGYLAGRPVERGLWLLDEPEAALSFSSCLALLGLLGDLAREGSQVIMATHSPLLMACPGATVLEIDDRGFRTTAWEELEVVGHWRSFLDGPDRYLRHLRD